MPCPLSTILMLVMALSAGAILLLWLHQRKKIRASWEGPKLRETAQLQENQLFQTLPLGVVFHNAEGRITAANPAAQRILGLSLEQMQNRTALDPRWNTIHEDGTPFPGETHPATVTLATGLPQDSVIMGVFNPVSNATSWIQVHSVPLFLPENPKPHTVYTTFEDITAQKAGQEKQRLFQARLNEVFKISPIGIALLSLEGHFFRVNPRICSMLGRSEEEMLALTFKDITHPDDLENSKSQVKALLEGQSDTFRQEKRYLHKNGHTVWGEVYVSLIRDKQKHPIHLLAEIQEITERKRIESERQILTATLDILNRVSDAHNAISQILQLLRRTLDIEAVAIRLPMDADFRYAAHIGFDEEFIQAEDCLQARAQSGELLFDEQGKPVFECLCGKVVTGNLEPDSPLFTPFGSAFTNNSRLVLELPSIQAPRARPRNRCIRSGYLSFAIIPIKSGDKILGLLQLNDRKPDRLTLETLHFLENLSGSIAIALERRQAREQKEQTIRQLELANERFFKAFQMNPVSMAISRTIDSKIIHVNDAWIQLSGWSREEVIGQTRKDLKIIPDTTQFQEMMRTIADTGRLHSFPVIIKRKDGQLRHALMSAEALEVAGEQCLISSAVDVTEKVEMEMALRESEDRWRFALEGAGDGLWDWDAQTNQVFFSRQWKHMLGYCEEEIGSDFSEWSNRVHPEDLPATLSAVKQHLDGNTPVYFSEHRMRCKDGSYKWILDRGKVIARRPDGSPLRVIGTYSDLTHRKQIEEALLASEAWYRTILQTAMDGFLVLDLNLAIIQANEAYAQMSGFTIEELLQKKLTDLEAREKPEETQAHLKQLLLQKNLRFETVHRCKDGHLIDVETSAQVIYNGKVALVCFLRNLTERKKSDQEKELLQEQLNQSQKMESLGSLAGGVAHDLNNVLGAILGLSSSFRNRFSPPDPMSKALDTITLACTRGRDVVRSLLLFARQELQEESAINLNVLALDTIQLLSHTTLKKADLQTQLQEDLPCILGESSSLTHVLVNLCVNAIDAMPAGGTLTLATYCNKDHGVTLCVRDTGLGMTPEVLAKAMEPFFTTKPQGKGTGLGLSMVYGTMKAHEGEVQIHSKPGNGTEVVLTFPPGRVVNADQVEKADNSPANALSKHHILLVDDDELILASVSTILETLGHEVTTALSGQAALQKLHADSGISLIILDMNMPGVSGLQILPHLLDVRPEIKVLIASGYLDTHTASLVSLYPQVGVIAKPFTLDELEKALEGVQSK